MRDTKGPKGSEWIPYDYALKMLLALRRIANHDIDYDGDNAQGLIDIAASAIKGLENVRPTGATFDDILRLAHLDVCASGNTEEKDEVALAVLKEVVLLYSCGVIGVLPNGITAPDGSDEGIVKGTLIVEKLMANAKAVIGEGGGNEQYEN